MKSGFIIRELKQPRRRRQQKPHKFAYLTIKNRIFARFARAFFSFWHFEDVLVLPTTSNDLFCSCLDDVSIRWQMFNFLLCPKRWFQFNSRIVRTHFSNIMTLNNWKMIAETRSYIFRWRPRFRRRRGCLSSLILRKTLYKFKHMSAREESRAGVKKLFVSHIESHMINRAGVRFYIERHHKQKMISNKSLTLSRKKLAKYRAMVGKSDWRQKIPITHKRPTFLTNYRAMVGKSDWRQKITSFALTKG